MPSTCFQTAKQVEVIFKEVVLPEVSKLNDSTMNKNHRGQTQLSSEKSSRKRKMGLLLLIYLLSTVTQTNKQTRR